MTNQEGVCRTYRKFRRTSANQLLDYHGRVPTSIKPEFVFPSLNPFFKPKSNNMRQFWLTLLVISCAVVLALSISVEERAVQARFNGWMREHKRSYQSEEFLQRYQQWRNNLDIVERHNADNSKTYKLAMNEFSDMTTEEFAKRYLGEYLACSPLKLKKSSLWTIADIEPF